MGCMNNEAPMFGKYVKLIKTGEILKCNSCDQINQLVEIELPTGPKTVQRGEIDRISGVEEAEFLLKEKTNKD